MSLTDNRNSKYVLVEWDDGSGERTQWYLGHITQYRDHVPLQFQDIGPDAWPLETFSFFSNLMHHYMVCIQYISNPNRSAISDSLSFIFFFCFIFINNI